jgi:hypothetical protein
MMPGPNKSVRFQFTRKVTFPFEVLASYIAPLGFQADYNPASRQTLGADVVDEIESFQRETDDIYEPEKKERDQIADPSPLKDGEGVFVPRNYPKEEGS